jgi:hypothetical protein
MHSGAAPWRGCQAALTLNPVAASTARCSIVGSEILWLSRRGVYGASSLATSSSVRVMSSAASASSMCLVLSVAKSGRMKYGIADIVHAATSDQDIQETYVPMLGAVRQFIEACEGSREIRPGANPEDFLVLVGLLWRIPPTSSGEARVKRLLALAFRGLGANDE